MKKILLSLLFVLPLLAYGYTPLFGLGNDISSHTMKSSTITSETSLIEEASLIQSDATITSKNSLNEIQITVAHREIKAESNTVPIQVALPLLALAIGLFGFGANRRRV